MIKRFCATAAVLFAGLPFALGPAAASAKPIFMPTIAKEIQLQLNDLRAHLKHGVALRLRITPRGIRLTTQGTSAINPPAPPCPELGLLPSPLSQCGLPELPATTLPWPGNMAYYGGHVQVTPRQYIVYWGWGEPGAFPAGQPCQSEAITEGSMSATLACDPDGAGKRMADFVQQMGGTKWAGVTTQYFQTGPNGTQQNVTNPAEQLAGMWVDDTNSITRLPKTTSTAPGGSGNTYTDLAAEAERAVAHFGLTQADLANANIIIAQPPNYSDPNAISSGYCAFHDYVIPGVAGGIYNGLRPQDVSYTNMPYQLVIKSNGSNACGENFVNPGPIGKLDGFSIVLGHEIEETVTDPGAEDILGASGLGNQTFLGGWYDTIDANENGDKCAWVGTLLDGGGTPNVLPIPGAVGNMTGNAGTVFPVQSTWSNSSAAGLGYCAGAGTDLPVTG